MLFAPSVNCTKVVVTVTGKKKKFRSTKSLNVVFTIHCAYNVHCYSTGNCTKQINRQGTVLHAWFQIIYDWTN